MRRSGYFCAVVRFFSGIFLLSLLTLAVPARAQDGLYKAQVLWGQKKHDAAIRMLQRKLKASAQSADFYATLGNWTYQQGRYDEAVAAYEAGAQKTKNGARYFALPLARALFRAGRYGEAAGRLQTFSPQTAEGKWLLRAAQWASAQPKELVFPESMGVRINTLFPETFPELAADGSALYYSRRVKGIDEDLMRALPDSCGGWFSGVALPFPLNSSRQEKAQTISADGHYIFFGREDLKSENGWDGGGGDLYMSYTATPGDTAWSVPEPFGATINTPAYEGMPSLSADNKTLFFVSDRAGGLGGLDIWYSRFERGRWQQPVNAGPHINTPQNEVSPFLCADGKTLLFASNGQAENFGGYDLYRATLATEGVKKVQNLGQPINSPHDEVSPFTGLRGDTLYYATDQQGPPGNTDIWRCELPLSKRPAAVQLVRGQVVDSLSGTPLANAWVRLLDGLSEKEVGGFRSNRGDGSFVAFLRLGQPYLLKATQGGYKARVDSLLLSATDTLLPQARLALLPDSYVPPRHDSLLLRFSFRRNEISLSDSVRSLLEEIPKEVLAGSAEILVWSFTDISGTPMLNEEISDQRARLVADALVQLGFDGGKITAQGWGEQYPMAPNDTEEGRTQNRRAEVILRR